MIDLSYLKDWAWETEYLSQISSLIPEINAIALHWKSETLFRRWFPRLRSKYILDKLIIPTVVNDETAVIILSDELYRVPKEIPALAVFKQYVSDKDVTSIPFPLGVRRGFPCLSPKSIGKRTIDVGFVGRMYPHRKTFLAELSNHPKLRRFRLKLTCAPRMPANALYQSHPGVQVDEINDVDRVASVLQSVLEASENHEAFQQRSLLAWESRYSPQAVAAMIGRTVESKKKGNRS